MLLCTFFGVFVSSFYSFTRNSVCICKQNPMWRFFSLFAHNEHTAYHGSQTKGTSLKKNVQEITSCNTDEWSFFLRQCPVHTHNHKIFADEAICCIREWVPTAQSAIPILDAYPRKLFKSVQISFDVERRSCATDSE